MRRIIISILMLFLLFSVSVAQESVLTITDMKVEPSTVNPGGKVLISCKVTHSAGPMDIERVAATVFHGDWVTAYPKLYDDGTNGDKMADDGIFSIEIKAPNSAGEAKIVFSAVDKDKHEIESEPIILTVE
jgi:hypothetical protein